MKLKIFALALGTVLGMSAFTSAQDSMMKQDSMKKQDSMMKQSSMTKKPMARHRVKHRRYHRRHHRMVKGS